MKRRAWHLGSHVRIELDDGQRVKGSVWSEGDEEGSVWVALEDGRYARVWKGSSKATILAGRGQDEQSGRAA